MYFVINDTRGECQGSSIMVPEEWYLVQYCANVVEPGTKGKGTGTKPIRVGTNKNFVHGCFWDSFDAVSCQQRARLIECSCLQIVPSY